ncbi:MAG: HNH endonuclease [Acidobacteriota bacterium]|nr:HNH endonuclease [Acidobacteriota bacterium]
MATRFWSKVQGSDEGCWLWLGSRGSKGYGQLRIFDGPIGDTGRLVRAHRISYELNVGPIPTGLWVLHHCDNPPCVRPDHLFLGTVSDNAQDMLRKGRGVFQQHPERHPRGEAHPMAKLSIEDVAELRRLREIGWSQNALSRRFRTTQSNVWRIIHGHNWKAVA